MKKDVEILAPAGTYEILKAAIYAGADAVYVGGSQFGARAFAGNLSQEELLSAIDFVHVHHKKIYLTVNTLLKDDEMGMLYAYLAPLYERGLDAVIVQDLGVLSFISSQFPGLCIHASTQMTVTSVISAAYLESLGVERIVPARELSLAEIKKITAHTQLEVECFVHGALCYGYSGQCLMSSLIGGRSGNRGQCAQPCRLPYQTDNKKASQDLLSLKDLATIHMIPELVTSGITSFKIEGRMKQVEYVTTVVSMYRKYVDRYRSQPNATFVVEENDHRELLAAYQRRGYVDGYYNRQNGTEMLSLKQPDKIVASDTLVKGMLFPKIQEKIKGEFILIPDVHATLKVQWGDIKIGVEGEIVQPANKQPLSKDRIEAQLKKTGNTPFAFEQIVIEMKEEVFLPMQSLNDIRRRALEKLETAYLEPFRRKPMPEMQRKKRSNQVEHKGVDTEPSVSVLVETIEQLRVVKGYSFINRVYLEDGAILRSEVLSRWKPLIQEIQQAGKTVYLAMARIFRTQAITYYDNCFTQEASALFDGMLIRNLEGYAYLKAQSYQKPIIADANVYQWNQYAKKFWWQNKVTEITAPVELNYKELKTLDISDMEYIIYGYQPVMISAGCVKKTVDTCDKKEQTKYLTDRYRKAFAVKNYCNYCYNVIYNSVPLCLLGQEAEINGMHPRSIRLEFYQERVERMTQILEWFDAMWVKKIAYDMPELEHTKGHFKRGVK